MKHTIRYRGTSLAFTLCVLCTTQNGCLVTEGIDFPEEENVAPLIFARQGSPSPITGPLRTAPGNELAFEVVVQDPNITQDLEYVLLRDFDPESGVRVSLNNGVLPATGEVERSLDFRVQNGEIGVAPGNCARLDLFVTSAFQRIVPAPELPGDLARATWLVAMLDDLEQPSTNVLLTGCP